MNYFSDATFLPSNTVEHPDIRTNRFNGIFGHRMEQTTFLILNLYCLLSLVSIFKNVAFFKSF